MRRIETAMQTVDALARRLVHPAERLRTSRQHLQHLAARLSAAMKHEFAQLRSLLEKHQAVLSGLDHRTVLARGYSLTLNARREIVRSASMVALGERIVTTLAAGEIESDVTKKG
jgi:exodeoxyribonuclease VII large subunit